MRSPEEILLGLVWYAAFLFSLTFHEAAHAWVALRGGDPTAYAGGQVSLDPRPHMRREPIGTVVVPILFFVTSGWMIGWASTPFDPRWAWRHPRRAGWMSLAGPGANLLLFALAGLLIRGGLAAGVFEPPESLGFARIVDAAGGGSLDLLASLLSILFTLNLLLAVFNLIPFPPLDGSGVLAIFLSADSARRLQLLLRRPALSLLGLFAAWYLIGELFRPAFVEALRFLYGGL
jgi:Zn-dependent protease